MAPKHGLFNKVCIKCLKTNIKLYIRTYKLNLLFSSVLRLSIACKFELQILPVFKNYFVPLYPFTQLNSNKIIRLKLFGVVLRSLIQYCNTIIQKLSRLQQVHAYSQLVSTINEYVFFFCLNISASTLMLKIICLESWLHTQPKPSCKEIKWLYSIATKLTLPVAFTGLKIY